MIVLRKIPCVRIIEGVVFYPGMNGNVPTSLLENSSFQQECEVGNMTVIDKKVAEETKSDQAIPSAPNPNREDTIDKPDMDLIETVLQAEPRKAIRIIKDILKLATIIELQKIEKRGSVLAALNTQKDNLVK